MSGPLDALGNSYRGRRVLVTGHTGFKGGWLTLWLEQLGAQVFGLALPPDPKALALTCGLSPKLGQRLADVRQFEQVRRALDDAQPDVVFHLAAQPLVRRSYVAPLETLQTNVLGTANVLEAVRQRGAECAVVVVSSDKCYRNRETELAYREDDALGGHDVYSMSKAGTELVVESWRSSFFPVEALPHHQIALASARAGNVIGGGDWAADRLVPDLIGALRRGRPVTLRNPHAVRPWQHVLEPLGGYLLLGAALLGPDAAAACDAFNFGPNADSTVPVLRLAELAVRAWGHGQVVSLAEAQGPHEAGLLRLSSDRAFARLGWTPRWTLAEAVQHTVAWYRAQASGMGPHELRDLCEAQLESYVSGGQRRRAAA